METPQKPEKPPMFERVWVQLLLVVFLALVGVLFFVISKRWLFVGSRR
jgi:hypothetical protein